MGKSRKKKDKKKGEEEQGQGEEEEVFVLPEPAAPPEWVQAGIEGRKEAETLEHVFLEGAVVCKKGARHKANCEGNAFCLQGIKGAQSQPPVYDVGFDALDRATSECAAGAEAFAELVARHDTEGILRRVRDPASVPAGLRNLGNTCYMNAYLQSLFAVAPFRELLYRWAPRSRPAESAASKIKERKEDDDEAAKQDIVGALQSLFARMDASAFTAADPGALVEALGVDPHVQQDPQEFEQLFLSLVQEQLEAAGLGADMRALFEGAAEYTTVCCACCATRLQPHRFMDVALPVGRASASLDAGLRAYTAPETLTGANQYRCSACGRLVDATRRLSLRALPPVLTVHLLRFQYDIKTASKKKKHDAFSFPRTIDLQPFMTEPGEDKGEDSKDKGKGKSQDKDKEKGKEKEKDKKKGKTTTEDTQTKDEDAPKESNMKYELFAVLIHQGETANSGHYVCYASPDADAGARWFEYDDSTVTDVTELVNALFDANGARITANSHNRLQALWSHNAYALVYRRVGATSTVRPTVPEPLLERAVTTPDAEAMRFVDALKRERAHAAELVKKRSTLVSAVTQNSQAVAGFPREELRFVATDWLTRFITREDCGAIANSALVCEHGKLSPACHALAKCVRADVWTRLAAQFGGGPELALADACPQCLAAHCRDVAARVRRESDRAAVVAQLDKERRAQQRLPRAQCYWISRAWVDQWLRAPDAVDYACLTAPITCAHGALSPDAAARMLVSAALWSYFVAQAPSGVRDFGGTTDACTRCAEEDAAREAETRDLREAKKREQGQFAGFLRHPHHTTAGRYHLVDFAWFCAWKGWLADTRGREPAPAPFSNAALLCPHGMLAYNPCEYIAAHAQQPCPYAAVPDALWAPLCKLRGEPGTPDIVLTLAVDKEPTLSCDTCWACLCRDDDESAAASASPAAESTEDQLTSFASGTFTLQRLPGRFSSVDEVKNAAATSVSDAAATTAGAHNSSPREETTAKGTDKPRRSARLAEKQRRERTAKTVTQQIKGVDSSWTVQGLKMHLFANYDSVLDCGMPDEQVLVLPDGTVLDDARTLDSYRFRNGATTITLGILAPSIGSPSAGSASDAQRPLETGFAGSRLLRSSGCLAVPPAEHAP